MQEPKGPVLVSVPVDDWDVPTDYVPAHQVGHHVQPDTTLLGQLADALARCASPAFVVGAEVDRSRAWAPVVQLAEKFGARVFAAPMIGRSSFPEDHALFAGFLRPRMEHVRECLERHDLVFVIGAPIFTYNVQGTTAPMLEGSKVFQLVEDPNVAAWTPIGTSIVGNIRVGVEYLLGQAGPASRPWPAAKAPVPRVRPPDGDARLSVACVMQALADARHRSDIIIEEAPSARGDMQTHLPIYETGTYYTMCSGGLGYGLPAAVGIALAQRDRRVIAVIGDGSCMYSMQALWSAVELGLSMTIVILQNGRYAAMQNMSKALGFADTAAIPGIELPHLDFVQLANGHGCQASSVSNARELPAAIAQALRSKGPFLLSVEVE
jgi:benzoylformate decarboxylase